MNKINFSAIKKIDWLVYFKKNKYAVFSVIIFVFYFYITFFAMSFIVKDIRDAFGANNESTKNQVVNFDIETYQKIAPRFNRSVEN